MSVTDTGRSRTVPPIREYDVVVIGAGVAGLAFTLRLSPHLRVALLTKAGLGESNTRYAQGGLAAAVGDDDSTDLHYTDTITAGAGLCDPEAVRTLVDGAPDAVRWLVDIGTSFDRDGDRLLLGREGAHSRRRVLHAGGDATGAEIERALVAQVRADPDIAVFEGAFARDLVVVGGRCVGVIADPGASDDAPVIFAAPMVVLAAGGAGQLWATTSNPIGATADGLAMALRAGLAAADLEFMQFHPTVLAVPGSAPFLVSEAVRGEGAYLRGADGVRFMPTHHPQAELAPRDIVARAIQRQMMLDNRLHVDLDLRHLDADQVRSRFPTIAAELARRGLDLARDLIPIAPAAHYYMGGIVAGSTGETSLPGLLAIGEASCTGVHGANRLASNSLLEGLVFGLATADRIGTGGLIRSASLAEISAAADASDALAPMPSGRFSTRQVAELRTRSQAIMSRYFSVVRNRAGMSSGMAGAASIGSAYTDALAGASDPTSSFDTHSHADDEPASARSVRELANMLDVTTPIMVAAMRREESRGAHYFEEHPEQRDSWAQQHLILRHGPHGTWSTGALADALPRQTAV